MKLVIFSILFTVFSQANASETIVLKCSEDDQASDGALKELIVSKTANGEYKYSLLVESSGMDGVYKEETKVELGHCAFSKKNPLIGECTEQTMGGFSGKNHLTVALSFSGGRDQIRATNYLSDNYAVSTSQEVSFDTTSCEVQE